MDTDTILKLATPALVGIATAGFAYFKDRWERKQEPEAIKRATAQVTFWKLLSEAQANVLSGPDLEASRQVIAKQLSDVANVLRLAQKVANPSAAVTDTRPPQLFRRLLFLYPPPKRWIWVFRFYFYYFLLAAPLAVLRLNLEYGASFKHLLIIFLGFLFFSVAFWWLTRYFENKAR